MIHPNEIALTGPDGLPAKMDQWKGINYHWVGKVLSALMLEFQVELRPLLPDGLNGDDYRKELHGHYYQMFPITRATSAPHRAIGVRRQWGKEWLKTQEEGQ